METYIILIPVGFKNARKTCENLQDSRFNNATDLRNEIYRQLNINLNANLDDDDFEGDVEGIIATNLNDFMDGYNDQFLDGGGYFLGYVQVKKEQS